MHTTKTHFKLFKQVALQWIDNFGLKSWDVQFKHEYSEDNNLAWISYNVPGGWVLFCLNTDWGIDEPTDRNITKAAMHEVGELFIAKLDYLARERYINSEEIGIEGHKIINTLINFLRKIKA